MAAVSAAPTSATTLTPPSSSHENRDPWSYAVGRQVETKTSAKDDGADMAAQNTTTQNGSSSSYNPAPGRRRKTSTSEMPSMRGVKSAEGFFSSSIRTDGGPQDDPRKRRFQDRPPDGPSDEESKWIHRDKLARIESEELQAAGIILPRQAPRPRKEWVPDQEDGSQKSIDSTDLSRGRSRDGPESDSEPRPPEEAVADPQGGHSATNSAGKGSRIPVAKIRSRSASASVKAPETTAIPSAAAAAPPASIPSPVLPSGKRVVTDLSPKKGSTPSSGTRKISAPVKTSPPGSRPKTRAGLNNRDPNLSPNPAANRPGRDLSPPNGNVKQPEGEPPWMISAYKPDPRLPPDQQLLPTVARRLQQEKWEKEGKFGNVYDKEFRPLNDDVFEKPPETLEPEGAPKEDEAQVPTRPEEQQQQIEWPLKRGSSQRVSSYSAMPKISKVPPSPVLSPRSPQAVGLQRTQTQQTQLSEQLQATRLPEEPPETPAEKRKAALCGCCTVM